MVSVDGIRARLTCATPDAGQGGCQDTMQADLTAKPTQFGNYQIVRKIASGGMAEVYEAYRVGLENFQTRVALKCIRPEMTADERFLKMFINEAHLGSQLHHPNIVQIQDFNRVDDIYYLAMEYVEGIDLSRFMRRASQLGEPLPRPVMLDITLQALAGMGYAHTAKGADGKPMHIVHRDIKPSNFLLNRQGTLKIADFGIAKAATSTYQTQTQDHIKGTLKYMSPEQVDGAKLTPSADIFSLCVIVYELITGRELFDAPTIPATLIKIATANVGSDLNLIDQGWPEIGPVMRKALHRDPLQRFASAEELIRVLRTFRDRFASEGALERFLRAHPEMFDDTPVTPAPETLNTPADGLSRPGRAAANGQAGMEAISTDPGSQRDPGLPELAPLADLQDLVLPAEPDDVEDNPSRASSFQYRAITPEAPRGRTVQPIDEPSRPFSARGGIVLPGQSVFPGVPSQPSGSAASATPYPPTPSAPASVLTSGLITLPPASAPPAPPPPPPPAAAPFDLNLTTSSVPVAIPDAPSMSIGEMTPTVPHTLADEPPRAAPARRSRVVPVVLALVAVVVVAALVWIRPWKTVSPAMLNVNSTPAGAHVLFDGVDTGAITPTTVRLPLEKSQVTLRLEADNGLVYQQELTYTQGQMLTMEAALGLEKLAPGTLTIDSNPKGAEIFLDRNPTGKVTPARIEGLEPGVHTIELRLADRPPRINENVTVAPGAESSVVMDMPLPQPTPRPEPIKQVRPPDRGSKRDGPMVRKQDEKADRSDAQGQGKVIVNSSPPESRVYIDGEYVGEAPVTRDKLPAGKHKLRMVLGDGRAVEEHFRLADGETKKLVYDFESQSWITR